jgi:hypothetical protein
MSSLPNPSFRQEAADGAAVCELSLNTRPNCKQALTQNNVKKLVTSALNRLLGTGNSVDLAGLNYRFVSRDWPPSACGKLTARQPSQRGVPGSSESLSAPAAAFLGTHVRLLQTLRSQRVGPGAFRGEPRRAVRPSPWRSDRPIRPDARPLPEAAAADPRLLTIRRRLALF